MLGKIAIATALSAALVAAVGIASVSSSAIRYSPDTLVDTIPAVGYVEPSIAADPLDSKVLVAAAESAGFSTIGLFVSWDGGYNWRTSSLALGNGAPLGDVQLASAADGKLYFAVLGSEKLPSGASENGLHLFASTDRGDTFHHLTFLHGHHGYDHEQLAVDTTHSRYRGNVYMTVLYGLQDKPQLNACGLLRSTDGGRSIEGPVQVMSGWCFNSRPAILSNGTVVFPFFLSGKPGMSGAPPMTTQSQIEVAISKDGGKTLSAPHAIGTYTNAGYAGIMKRLTTGQTDFDGDPVPQFAAHGMTIYAAWSDLRTGRSQLLFCKSTDGGAHFSAPKPILRTGDARDSQYQVALVVNGSGNLGVSYLQYRAANKTVAEMFADSSDRGATFSPGVRIQSAPSGLGFSRNAGYSGFAEPIENSVFVGFTQPEHRFPSGGDYVDMAVDRDGAFHPIWADARTGTYQVWSANVSTGAADPLPATVPANVGKSVDLQFGAGSWDPNAHILSIPARIHNAGTRPLYPPFVVSVKVLDDPYIPAKDQPKPWPSFVNADNGQTGIGATYTYTSDTLGNIGYLAPGAVSATRIWKIKLEGANTQPSIVVDVNGSVAK